MIIFIALIVAVIYNTYNWIVCGNQQIKISMPEKIYSNSDLDLSIIAQKNNVDLDTKTKVELVNQNGEKVKDTEIKYDGNNAVISIPDIEEDTYFIEATVSSEARKR